MRRNDQHGIKLACLTTETIVTEGIEAKTWHEAVKSAAQLHPELPGPFYTSLHYWWMLHDERPSLYKSVRKIDRGLGLIQGNTSVGVYAVRLVDDDGTKRIVPIRIHDRITNIDVVEAATFREAVRQGWKFPLTICGAKGFQYSRYQYLVVRRGVRCLTSEQFQRTCKAMDEMSVYPFTRKVRLYKPACSDDLEPYVEGIAA